MRCAPTPARAVHPIARKARPASGCLVSSDRLGLTVPEASMRHNAKNENIATSAAGQSSAESLGQLVAHLRKTRTQLPEGWAGRISEAKWPTGMSEEKIVSELSSSMLRVRERLLILSVVGAIDWQRARQLTERLMRGIRVNRAK